MIPTPKSLNPFAPEFEVSPFARDNPYYTAARATSSRLPDQKNENTSRVSSVSTQAGMWMSDATYQTRERARALITRALPRKVRTRERQDLRTWSTAEMRGRQLSSSRLPGPINTPRTLSFEGVQSKGTGESVRPRQPPNQRPLDFPKLIFDPDARSY